MSDYDRSEEAVEKEVTGRTVTATALSSATQPGDTVDPSPTSPLFQHAAPPAESEESENGTNADVGLADDVEEVTAVNQEAVEQVESVLNEEMPDADLNAEQDAAPTASLEEIDGPTEAYASEDGEDVETVTPVEPTLAIAAAPDQDQTTAEESVAAGSDETDGVDGEATGASFTPIDEDDDTRPRRLKDLEVGTELEGRVTSIALYGIFVDVGVGRDGLVHISEMSDVRIDSPSDIVQIGDTVNVRVKGLDVDARRISLTMRSPRDRSPRNMRQRRGDIDRDALSDLKVGDTVEGVITGMAPFGAFADIGVGKDGLIHISELSEGRVERPEDAVQVGERYNFKLLEVDPEGTRISLSLRRAQRTQRLQQLEIGQILDGTVSGLAPFGAFVDINVGRDGLVHISELSEGRVDKVEDVVKVGDPVQVRVLEVDPQSKRISLTMRLEDRPEETPEPASDEHRRGSSGGGGGRSTRSSSSSSSAVVETYVAEDESDEAEPINATLEDLLNKYGGSKRKDRRRHEEEEEEDEEDRFNRRQRDAHRRTLQQISNDE